LTNKVEAVGDIPFVAEVDTKNPVNLVNATFPTNIMLGHGKQDIIVDYRCTEDFYRVVDPAGSRSDVVFFSVEEGHHDISSWPIISNNVKAWLDHHVLGLPLGPSDFEPRSASFSRAPAERAISMIVYALGTLAVGIVALVFVAKPRGVVVEPAPFTGEGVDQIPAAQPRRGLKGVLVFWGAMFGAGVAAIVPQEYIIHELVLGLLASSIGLVWLWGNSHPPALRGAATQRVKADARNAIPWALAIAAVAGAAALITSSAPFEDATLQPGLRVTWWIPAMTALFGAQIYVAILTARVMLGTTVPPPAGQPKSRAWLLRRLAEPFVVGLLYGVGFFLFLVWELDATFAIPAWEIEGLIIPVFALFFGALALAGDILAQALETVTKSSLVGALVTALVLALAVGSSYLIFFY
jgi:hypothetical protein